METAVLNEPERGAVAFTFDVPLTALTPGDYICQINVIDDAGGSFTFPRLALRVVSSAPAAPAAAAALAPATGGVE